MMIDDDKEVVQILHKERCSQILTTTIIPNPSSQNLQNSITSQFQSLTSCVLQIHDLQYFRGKAEGSCAGLHRQHNFPHAHNSK